MATLALYGSGEFLPWSRRVDDWCLARADGSSDRVLIVPTASAPEGEAVFFRWARMGFDHYREAGLSPEVVELRTRQDADRPDLAAQVEGARLIFFSGGNPGYLAEAVTGTGFWRAVVAAVSTGTALAGCSAGACLKGTLVPFIGGEGVVRWIEGTRLLANAYIAPHFDRLDSYSPGMRRAVIGRCPPGSLLVGLDEKTALCGDGDTWEVVGVGGVWIGHDDHDLRAYRHGDRAAVRLGLDLT